MDHFVHGYGPDWRSGVLTDHLGLAIAAGWTVHVAASGRTYVSDPKGETHPVLCSELVEIRTEDGRITGRCGEYVNRNAYACVGHASELDAWLDLSEPEKAEWERRNG